MRLESSLEPAAKSVLPFRLPMKEERNGSRILRPLDCKSYQLGFTGVRFMIGRNDSNGRFSLVEHPMEPRALAAPLHRHRNEDEYSFVIEGRIGAKLGGEVVFGNPGDLVFKPRKQWHTFWNAGDEPARILEIISPAGFEHYFEELANSEQPLDPQKVLALAARYDVELDFGSIPDLIKEHGVRFPSGA
jgi:mannose-6-phosphate isomerase-like protein (cupin superfamily)